MKLLKQVKKNTNMKIKITESQFKKILKEDNNQNYELKIRELLESGQLDSIELAEQLAIGLDVDINDIIEDIYGIILKLLGFKSTILGLTLSLNATTLDLVGSDLYEIPEIIGNYHKLWHINISGLWIETLPDSIGHLYNLEIFDAQDSGITHLPESFGNLTKLQEADFSNSRLYELPKSIVNLKNLKKLNISGTNLSQTDIREFTKQMPHVYIE